MKAAIFVGLGIGLAAAGGLAAEMPNAKQGIEVAAGVPTPLAPAPAPTREAARFVMPIHSSGPVQRPNRTKSAAPLLNPYHPRWVVQVFGH
jgi:hypothetical protein